MSHQVIKWRKVDWKAGDTITIRIDEKDALALNYDHGWMVSIEPEKIVDFDADCVKEGGL